MPEDYAVLITDHPLFGLLDKEDAQQLISYATPQPVEINEIVVKEGELIDSIYIIASGRAEVSRKLVSMEKKHVLHIAEMGKGDIIGLSAEGFFSSNGLRKATIIATSRMLLLKINLRSFLQFLRQPHIRYPDLKKQCEDFLLMQALLSSQTFSHLFLETAYSIATNAKPSLIPAGTSIYQKGEKSVACYYILAGKVVLSAGETEEKQTINLYQLFGDKGLMDDRLRTESATAETEVELLIVDRALLKRFANNHSSSFFKRLIAAIWGKRG